MGIFRSNNFNTATNITSPSSITVQENKAPTDDSIRLFSEIQEKALNSICKMLPVVNNNITFVIAKSYDPLSFNRFFIKVTVNGVEHTTILSGGFRSNIELSEEIINWFAGLFHKEFFEAILDKNING